MELDLVEKKIFYAVFPISFFVFLFLPFNLAIKILYFSIFLFFLIFFLLTSGWAEEFHPERKYQIAFLVTVFHTFFFFLSGILGGILAVFILKISPFLLEFFKEIFKF